MSKDRKLLLASAAFCAIASSAFAADLPTKKGPPPAPIAMPYSWTGFNVGIQGGYGWGDESDNFSTTVFEEALDHFDANGAIGGLHVGYDQQFGSLVLGIRGEIDASGLSGSKFGSTTFNYGGANCSEGCSVASASLAFRNTWQAFLLGRVGIAFDRLLVYATGGLAIADDRESVAVTRQYYIPAGDPYGSPDVWSGKQTKTLYGGAIGLGAEYAFDEHWRIGAEWRYAYFGKGDYSTTSTAYPQVVSYKAGFSENLALVNLSYRF